MANTTKWKIIPLPKLCLNSSNMKTDIHQDYSWTVHSYSLLIELLAVMISEGAKSCSQMPHIKLYPETPQSSLHFCCLVLYDTP